VRGVGSFCTGAHEQNSNTLHFTFRLGLVMISPRVVLYWWPDLTQYCTALGPRPKNLASSRVINLHTKKRKEEKSAKHIVGDRFLLCTNKSWTKKFFEEESSTDGTLLGAVQGVYILYCTVNAFPWLRSSTLDLLCHIQPGSVYIVPIRSCNLLELDLPWLLFSLQSVNLFLYCIWCAVLLYLSCPKHIVDLTLEL
jgi:hypothetical protein